MFWFFIILALLFVGAPLVFLYVYTHSYDYTLPPMSEDEIDKYYENPKNIKK